MEIEEEIGTPKKPFVAPEDEGDNYIDTMDQAEHSELSDLFEQGKVAQELALLRRVAKVAKAQPAMRKHLSPLMRRAKAHLANEIGGFRAVSARAPKVTAKRWASMTLPEKHVAMKRLAHKAIMPDVTKAKVRDGEAFMVYMINPEKNNSKFYEGVIRQEDGGFRVIRRWGRMTDSGKTGRIDGGKYDTEGKFWFDSLGGAQRELQKHYAKRMGRGYVSAFGRDHLVPGSHKKLPMGQYPVGLGSAGFGWGGQSVKKCIPALRRMVSYLRAAHAEVKASGRSDIVAETLNDALMVVRDVGHEDSTMAQKLLKLISKPLRRAEGSPRFIEDADGARMAKELYTIINYVTKQTSYCAE